MMIRMTFADARRSGTSLAAMAAALAVAGTAHAQQTLPPAGQTAEPSEPVADDAGEEIVVTGFRAALESAVATKRESDIVAESISAEDIGKLPDASIAESIARLPGLTSQRVSGRSNSISIRGFAPDFSTTLLNGREQTSTGDNRAVEYDQYPAEIMSQVLVYKTAQPSLIGQGLSGTVDLRTVRPLDYGRRAIAIGGRGTYADLGALNAGSTEYGYRVSGTYIDQFANDTIGIALSANYLDEPYQIQEFNAWGYADAPGGEGGVIGGSKSYVTSTQLKRLGLSGTLQWRPTPNFTSTFDGFFSDFDDDQIKRGIELPLAFSASPLTVSASENGFVTAGSFANVEGVIRNDSFQRKAKLYSFGWNNKWEGDDGWNAMLDVSYSKTDRNEIVIETYAGTGYGAGNGATDTIDFVSTDTGTIFSPTLDYSDPDLIRLTDPLGWGGANVQAGYLNDRQVEDRIWQYRVEIEKELDGFLKGVKVGLNYTDRDKSLVPDEYLLVLPNGATEAVIPDEFILGSTDQGFLGLGSILSYDPRELLDAGIYTQVFNTSLDIPAKAFTIAEDLMTMYAQADIEQEVGSATLTGNFGVQAIWTEQHSSGFVTANGSLVPTTTGDDYWDVMPAINLSLRTANDFVIRAAAARQVQRPRLDDMRVALSYGFDTAAGLINGSGGNPFLRPIRSNSYDLTVEKYFGNAGYLAVQGFYKDLKSYVYNLEQPFDYTGYPPPSNIPAGVDVPAIGLATIPINGSGGSIYGVELAGTLPFGEFVGALDGFGVTGGLSYTETEIAPTPGQAPEDIPGYSKWVANGTGYFEKWGFNLRGSVRYRSTFVGELSGFGANRVRRRALDETIIDAQIGYEFQEGSALQGFSIFVQGQNLTDEPFATVDPRGELAIIDYQTYGRRFLAGAAFRF
ncbi:TonB-dependent receptor [Sphingomonas japonica]|uniref:Iron complex outermembrane receptor protein n=1 Tax=Sphingomonas japonica TaxID=511662 RepID=A0ABX0TZ14_9SPHN|nr:TonB-dependent receptor [Sphingomonas japonica]NIJ23555.1 iron complex outermembrane receptor protein [Sphingomonas japonica]